MGKTSSFTIGKVTGVHGLNGNLKVWSYAESIDTFAQGKTVLLKFENGMEEAFIIARAAPHKKGVLLSLGGIDTRELAEAQVGKFILMDREQIPEPDDDSWFWDDLIGLEVVDRKRGFIGIIETIFPTGADDILVVQNKNQDESRNENPVKNKETLIPMNYQVVISVDIDQNIMMVDLPEGL